MVQMRLLIAGLCLRFLCRLHFKLRSNPGFSKVSCRLKTWFSDGLLFVIFSGLFTIPTKNSAADTAKKRKIGDNTAFPICAVAAYFRRPLQLTQLKKESEWQP